MYKFFSNVKDDKFRIALNPMAFKTMLDKPGKELRTEKKSDLYVYLDLLKGYMMHRYICIELVKNRIYAMWRRKDRKSRIDEAFCLSLDQGIFPQAQKYSINYLPSPENDNFGGDASKMVKELPEILKLLKRIDLHISVSENAIYFDSDLTFKEN